MVDQDRIELLKEHSKKDENGEPIIHDDTYDVKDMKAFNEDLQELYSEKMVIEGGDNREMLRTIKAVLKNLRIPNMRDSNRKSMIIYVTSLE